MSFEATNEGIGAGQFWRALGARPVGATVISTSGDDGPEGFLGLSFAHVSAQPPTVLVSTGKSTSALASIRRTGCFAANVLPANAEKVARAFGGDLPRQSRFKDLAWSTFITSAPVLDLATAVFDCRVLREIEEEGAIIFLGRVVGVKSAETGQALIAFQGGYLNILEAVSRP